MSVRSFRDSCARTSAEAKRVSSTQPHKLPPPNPEIQTHGIQTNTAIPCEVFPNRQFRARREMTRSGVRVSGKEGLRRNVKRFRGGLVFQTHRLLYHSTLGLRVIRKKKKKGKEGLQAPARLLKMLYLSLRGRHIGRACEFREGGPSSVRTVSGRARLGR